MKLREKKRAFQVRGWTFFFLLLLFAIGGFNGHFELVAEVFVRRGYVPCVALTLSRRSAPAPGPSYTAPRLGGSSSPPWWRELPPCCCAENLQPAVSVHAERTPPLQLDPETNMQLTNRQHSLWQQSVHCNTHFMQSCCLSVFVSPVINWWLGQGALPHNPGHIINRDRM